MKMSDVRWIIIPPSDCFVFQVREKEKDPDVGLTYLLSGSFRTDTKFKHELVFRCNSSYVFDLQTCTWPCQLLLWKYVLKKSQGDIWVLITEFEHCTCYWSLVLISAITDEVDMCKCKTTGQMCTTSTADEVRSVDEEIKINRGVCHYLKSKSCVCTFSFAWSWQIITLQILFFIFCCYYFLFTHRDTLSVSDKLLSWVS